MGEGKLLWGYHPATKTWIPLQVDANGKVVVDMSAIHKLQDADGDTGWDVEQAADEDKIHGKVKGVEAFLLNTAGILTLAKQSMAHVTTSLDQIIPRAVGILVAYDTEVYDVQSEFDSTVKTGTADATLANHLVDDTNSQFTADDVGAWVWNTTDNTYAKITAYNDPGDVTLDADIMVNGEAYTLYRSKFVCTEPGKYLCIGNIQFENIADTIPIASYIYKNGIYVLQSAVWSSAAVTSFTAATVLGIINCAAGDYLQHWCKHWDAGNEAIIELNVFFQVVKIA